MNLNRQCFLISVLWNVLLLILMSKNALSLEYSHEWAVQVIGGEDVAKEIASKNNFEYLGKIFDDVFHFRNSRVSKRSIRPAHHHHRKLSQDSAVRWAEQQVVKKRVKRDFHQGFNLPYKSPSSRKIGGTPPRMHSGDQVHAVLSDPKWPAMWYLNRGGTRDMNVERAWKNGVTGKGVVVTILDDGIEKDHPDLIQNYDPSASYDVNGRDPDPMPRYDLVDSNRHGTRCAGEVAAGANNSICAVGVAYEASVGGVRMLDGDVTDAVEARSLALNPQHIDIYSASWGPDDDGKTVDGPGQLATRAFVEGVTRGRNGKGSIFVWASGNGGRDDDNCNCDGYTNSIWTLSISSATEKGSVPWYSEACSSTLATTYSSGALGESQIITTDLHQGCTTSHTGTSASAPLAAGICALALHANMDLTWRDMQHVVVRTARPENLNAPDWQTNGVGRKVSHRFGYGLMDAYGMVELARNWTTVPPQRKCEVPSKHMDKLIPQKSYVTLTLEVSDCPGVNYLEHVQSKVTLIADRRGDIQIFLVSPAGTRSNLLAPRHRDNSRTGFHSWPFMTVHMWGESPLGIWKLEIHNNGIFYSQNKASVQDWTLLFHGTEVEPGEPGSEPNSVEKNIPSPSRPTHAAHFNNGWTKNDGRKGSARDQETRNPQPESGEEPRSSGPPTPSPAPVLSVGGVSLGLTPLGCASNNSIGCLECKNGYFLHQNQCFSDCPEGTFGQSGSSWAIGKKCSDCHYSCRKCSGPFDYECETCWPDAILYNPNTGERFCHSQSLMDKFQYQSTWLKITFPVLLLLFCFIVALAVLICRNRPRQEKHKAHGEAPTSSAISMGKAKPSGLSATYSPVAANDSDKLMTNIPFHDLTSDEDES